MLFHFLSFPTIFLLLLALSFLSAIFLLYPRVSLNYIPIHIGIITLPPIAALVALIAGGGNVMVGPFRFNALSWLLAFFVLTIGLIVQRFSVRSLLGDLAYRQYFSLLTLITIADSAAWLSNDLRLLLFFWGAALLGLTVLIRLKNDWKVATGAAELSGRSFALSWLLLFIALIWLAQATGHWQLTQVLKDDSLKQLSSWASTCISLLLVISVIIPAGQWPFKQWLLNSVVTPTPVSAVMHAGIVNVGGILLTLLAPLQGAAAQIILLVISGITVLIGTGIMLVHADYKRQLVGSTMAQMAFMLIQCALGAYAAAITHAVLHGLFKSTLFLQSGSAIQQHDPLSKPTGTPSFLWKVLGIVMGVVVGAGYWLIHPEMGYRLISALILGWSMAMAWTQLTSFDYGRIGRMVGIAVLAAASLVFLLIHSALNGLLNNAVQAGSHPAVLIIILLLTVLLVANIVMIGLAHRRTSKAYAILYLWLVHLGEPQTGLAESHPKYLSRLVSKGGSLR